MKIKLLEKYGIFPEGAEIELNDDQLAVSLVAAGMARAVGKVAPEPGAAPQAMTVAPPENASLPRARSRGQAAREEKPT